MEALHPLILRTLMYMGRFLAGQFGVSCEWKTTFCLSSYRNGTRRSIPFDIPQYLLIDMQLGGTWVGPVDSTDLPVEMEVDWVRHYQWK